MRELVRIELGKIFGRKVIYPVFILLLSMDFIVWYQWLNGFAPTAPPFWPNALDFIYTYGFVIVAVLLPLALSPVFAEESETGMEKIILSTAGGRQKLITAKITAALLFTLILILVLTIINLSTCSLFAAGFEQGSQPLQTLYKYREARYSLTILQYYPMQILIHSLTAVLYALIILLFSFCLRSSFLTFFCSGGLIGLPFILYKVFRNPESLPGWVQSIVQALIRFSLMQGLQVEKLVIDPKVYSFLGLKIPYLVMAVLVIAGSIPVITVVLYLRMKNYQVR